MKYSFPPQGTDHDLLMPLGTNCVMVHNEHHTMSMLIVFLQVQMIISAMSGLHFEILPMLGKS